jgi:uncharacterized protein YdhG (YjbR/CyaY superfamily)
MATKKKAPAPAKKPAKGTFSDAEREAMKARAKELKAEAKKGDMRAKGEAAVRDAIAEMPDEDRELAERIHTIVSEAAPSLVPKTWYGMPAYANADGKVICFFKAAAKFESRYATFGFNDAAKIDEGSIFPTSFAVKKITGPIDKQLRTLVQKAAR